MNQKKFLCVISLMTSFSLNAADLNAADLTGENQIEKQIEQLENEIHDVELKAMKSEVSSENYMKYEWGKYADEIEKAEEYDQKIELLKKQLEELKLQKKQLESK